MFQIFTVTKPSVKGKQLETLKNKNAMDVGI